MYVGGDGKLNAFTVVNSYQIRSRTFGNELLLLYQPQKKSNLPGVYIVTFRSIVRQMRSDRENVAIRVMRWRQYNTVNKIQGLQPLQRIKKIFF